MGIATRRGQAIACICSLFLVAGALELGCSSDSFTSGSSTDAGSDATSGDDSATTTDSDTDSGKPGCLTPPASVPGGDVAFCQAFAEIYSNCGSCETCRQEDVNNCAAFGESFSDAFKGAMITCKDTFNCEDLQRQSLGNSPCVADIVNASTPTTAQLGAQTAYCTHCPGDAGLDMPCDQFFALPDGGASPGTALLYMGESFATDIGTDCANNCGAISYGLCEAIHFCSEPHAPPKTTCTQGVCK